jgi:DNA-binding IclR family transcriptional regulator
MADNSSVQSVERTFDIIENLSSAPQGLTLLELSSDVGLPKSTVHRLLSTLTGRGYITQDPESKKYLLTLKLFEISSRSLAGFDILSAARPYLQHLSRITNEAVHLVVREGHEVVYIYKEDSSKNTVRMASIIPCTVPAWAKPSWPISPEANRSRSGKLRKSFLIPLKQ